MFFHGQGRSRLVLVLPFPNARHICPISSDESQVTTMFWNSHRFLNPKWNHYLVKKNSISVNMR